MTVMTSDVLGLPRGRSLTRADLATMPDDGHRYELLDGVLIVSPAPRRLHQRAVGRLFLALNEVCPSELELLFAPFDVVLADDTVIQPDLVIAPRDAYTDRELPAAPLLAIEVLSPSTRGIDLLLKKDRLRRADCRHYWVVDPDEPSIIAWALDGDDYREIGRAVGEATLELTGPLTVSLTPADLVR